MRIALGVEYDGSAFKGWQLQRHAVRTVQGELYRALADLASNDFTIVGAGRTDAGVHAAGQVAYCNAKQGASLPPGMPDWPAIRTQNGYPEPFGVKYWQIGNETSYGGIFDADL